MAHAFPEAIDKALRELRALILDAHYECMRPSKNAVVPLPPPTGQGFTATAPRDDANNVSSPTASRVSIVSAESLNSKSSTFTEHQLERESSVVPIQECSDDEIHAQYDSETALPFGSEIGSEKTDDSAGKTRAPAKAPASHKVRFSFIDPDEFKKPSSGRKEKKSRPRTPPRSSQPSKMPSDLNQTGKQLHFSSVVPEAAASEDMMIKPSDSMLTSAPQHSMNAEDAFIVYPAWEPKTKGGRRISKASQSSLLDAMKAATKNRSVTSQLAWIDLDTQTDSTAFDARSIKHLIGMLMLQPFTFKRLSWDFMGVLLMIYDTITIPLQFFDPPEGDFERVMNWMASIFWTFDICMNFLTGHLTDDGHVVIEAIKVAKIYMKSWFAFDVLLVMFDWFHQLAITDSTGTKHVLIMRLLRFVRLLRLLRFVRTATGLSRSIMYRLRSELLSVVMRILDVMAAILIVTHFIACCWYGVAKGHKDEKNWVEVYGFESASLAHRYACSFHWSLTQLVGSADIAPQNHKERTFAVLVLLAGFIICASAVGSITTAMTRIQLLAAQSTEQMTLLNRYLIDRKISNRLAERVHKSLMHALAEQKRNTPENKVQLLALLSEPLRIELHYEVYISLLENHPFFFSYNKHNPAAMRQICHHAISALYLARSDVLFSEGEMLPLPKMYFVLSGQMLYMKEGTQPNILGAGKWVAEPVLWTPWVFQGVTKAITDSSLVCLDSEQFQAIASNFKTSDFYPQKYALEFVACLNKLDEKSLTDISDKSTDVRGLTRLVFKGDEAETEGDRRRSSAGIFGAVFRRIRRPSGERNGSKDKAVPQQHLDTIVERASTQTDDHEDGGDSSRQKPRIRRSISLPSFP